MQIAEYLAHFVQLYKFLEIQIARVSYARLVYTARSFPLSRD